MLLAQIGIALGIANLATSDPSTGVMINSNQEACQMEKCYYFQRDRL